MKTKRVLYWVCWALALVAAAAGTVAIVIKIVGLITYNKENYLLEVGIGLGFIFSFAALLCLAVALALLPGAWELKSRGTGYWWRWTVGTCMWAAGLTLCMLLWANSTNPDIPGGLYIFAEFFSLWIASFGIGFFMGAVESLKSTNAARSATRVWCAYMLPC